MIKKEEKAEKQATGRALPISRTLEVLALALLGLLILLFSLRKLSDADLGFHLQGGQWIAENASFPSKDTYTYTVNENEYINLHWLFQISLHAIRSVAGYNGLSIYTALLALIVFIFAYVRMKVYGGRFLTAFLLLLIAVFCIQSRLLTRPEMFTYIFLGALLWILELYRERKKDLLVLIPVLMLLWVNSHGLFILGWLVLGAFALEKYLKDKKPDRRLWLFAGLGMAVCFINPYFHKGVLFPFYLFTRFGSDSIFSNIVEFSPVFASKDLFTTDFILFFVLLILYIFFFAAGIMRRRLFEYLLGAMFIYLSLTAIRNIPLFILVSLPFSVRYADEFVVRLSDKVRNRFHRPAAKFALILSLIIIVVFSIRLVTNAYYTGQRMKYKSGLGLDYLEQPVAAVKFLTDNGIDGRILNDLNTGGWLGWATRQPVFIDGRLEVMQEPFYKEYLSTLQEGGLHRIIAKYKPSVVLFDYEANISWIMQLRDNPAWRLVYADEVAAIYVRTSEYPDIPVFDFGPFLEKQEVELIRDETAVMNILKMKKKPRTARWMAGFGSTQQYLYPLYLKPGTLADLTVNFEAAEALYLTFVQHDRKHYHRVFVNLGLLYLKKDEFRKAAVCWRYVLEREPGNAMARKNLNYALSKLPKG